MQRFRLRLDKEYTNSYNISPSAYSLISSRSLMSAGTQTLVHSQVLTEPNLITPTTINLVKDFNKMAKNPKDLRSLTQD